MGRERVEGWAWEGRGVLAHAALRSAFSSACVMMTVQKEDHRTPSTPMTIVR